MAAEQLEAGAEEQPPRGPDERAVPERLTQQQVAQVLVQQVVDLFARGLRVGLQFEQTADFGVRHVERPALRNEGQLLDMLGGVDAIVIGGARSRGQQALRFIEADGLNADARALGEFANFHTR